jgi:predicted glycosyltransferase
MPELTFPPHAVVQGQIGVASGLSHKILLYSHDTFGMGNIRRTLLISEELIARYPGSSILIITGSPMIHAFRIPQGIDYIKLPCLDRVEAERYAPRHLTGCPAEVYETRAAILKESILRFDPDLMIVDKRPGGVGGELLPALTAIRGRGRHTRLVLGVRDILDEPERTRKVLAEDGSFGVIDRFYDEVWIYGCSAIFDTVREYGFPESVARNTYFCGYLKRPVITAERGAGPPRILVTTGGGGDGSPMIEAYLAGLSTLPRKIALRSTVIFGPQMPETRRQYFRQNFSYLADVTFLDFEAELSLQYAQADLVVSQAGYNTVCELLSFSRRAILIPRAHPVREQLIRARLLSALGYFEVIEPQDLNSEFVISKVMAVLNSDPAAAGTLDLDGLPRIGERVASLLQQQRWAAA